MGYPNSIWGGETWQSKSKKGNGKMLRQRRTLGGRLFGMTADRTVLFLLIGFLLAGFLFSGCATQNGTGDGQEKGGATSSSKESGITEIQGISVDNAPAWTFFSTDVRQLPDGLSSLERGLSENQWLVEGGLGNQSPFRFEDETIYRQVVVMGYDGQDYNTVAPEGRYLQTLKPPYEIWETEDYTDREMPLFDIHEEAERALSQEESSMMAKIAGAQYCQYADGEGRLYFGNRKAIWYLEDGKVRTLVNLSEGDLALTDLTGFLVNGEEATLWGKFGTKEYLVTIRREETAPVDEKQEILFVDSFFNLSMKQAIAEFNLMSPKWRIVTQDAGNGDYEAFRNRLQIEITDGGGPDILGLGVFLEEWEEFARKGYLEELDDLFAGQEEEYWDFCLQSGMVDGKRYALPVGNVILRIAVCSEEAAKRGGLEVRDPWDASFHTTPELMDFVRRSKAEIFQTDSMGEDNGFYFLTWYGKLGMAGNPYLDLEQGVSHLNEEPFIDLLEFAKEYSGRAHLYSDADYVEDLRSGRIAVMEHLMREMSDILYLRAALDGKACFIGFPNDDGKRFRATFGDEIMLNAASGQKEGALEFFRYLLSREGQEAYTVRGKEDGGPIFAQLSIRKDVVEERLEGAMHVRNDGKILGKVSFDLKALSQEDADIYRKILEETGSGEEDIYGDMDVILGILEEETESFWAGAKSAREVAENCHNRVQLYLREQ